MYISGHNCAGEVRAGGNIAVSHERNKRRSVRCAACEHTGASGIRDSVKAGTILVRSLDAIAACGCDNDSGVHLGERCIVNAKLLLVSVGEVVDNYIRARAELLLNDLALLAGGVDCNGFLVAIDKIVYAKVAVHDAACKTGSAYTVAVKGRVSNVGLDLYHFCAPVGKDTAGDWAHHVAGGFNYADTFK